MSCLFAGTQVACTGASLCAFSFDNMLKVFILIQIKFIAVITIECAPRQTIRWSRIVTIRRIPFAFVVLKLLPKCLGDKFSESFFITLGHPGFFVISSFVTIFIVLHCAVLGVARVTHLRRPIVVFSVFAELFVLCFFLVMLTAFRLLVFFRALSWVVATFLCF